MNNLLSTVRSLANGEAFATPSVWRRALIVLLCGTLASTVSFDIHAAEKLQFNRDIRPILSDRCFKCHGPDKASRKAGLRLDLPEEAYAERKKSGEHAIVPGKPDQSLVCQHIFSKDPDELMPPPDAHLALTPAEKETIRRWIGEGGQYQPHWAFIPLPDQTPVPAVKNRSWPRNEIDHFILARLEKAGIKPSPEASRSRWLRRVTYDLTGLPSTPAEADAFLADKSAGAYERVVDRLLASKHFGERMAVPWLDAARYADSYGYQSDQLCPTWPYRDWVVSAFNDNLPFDKFLTEQLAGDLLPHATRRQRLATAFNRLHRQTNEGGSIAEEWRIEYISDRVRTFSTTFLALTFECAHCHDHKFDPITQRDYYSLFAFFNSIDEYGLYNDSAHVPTPSLLLPHPRTGAGHGRSKESIESQKRLACLLEAARRGTSFHHVAQQFQPGHTKDIPGLAARFSFRFHGPIEPFHQRRQHKQSQHSHRRQHPRSRQDPARPFNSPATTKSPFRTSPEVFRPWDQYTVVFWLQLPKALTNAVIFHRSSEGTDVGFYGTELTLRPRPA